MGDRTDTCCIAHAAASAAAIADLIHDRHACHAGPACGLLSRGFNGRHAVLIPAGTRFGLRLSGHSTPGAADVEAETAWLARLASAAVPFHHAQDRLPDLDGRGTAGPPGRRDPARRRARAGRAGDGAVIQFHRRRGV